MREGEREGGRKGGREGGRTDRQICDGISLCGLI